MAFILYFPTAPGYDLPWSIVNIPSDSSLEKTDFPFATCGCKLQITSKLGEK